MIRLVDTSILREECKGDFTPFMAKLYGWVRRVREGPSMFFIDIYDGKDLALSTLASKDIYLSEKLTQELQEMKGQKESEMTDSDRFMTLEYDKLGKTEFLSDGCSIVVEGMIVKPPSDDIKQPFEMQIYRLRVIGGVEDPEKNPIPKSIEKKYTALRQVPFHRMKAPIMQSVFRIVGMLEFAIHTFMMSEKVTKIDPNILTMSDCEGAGETFKVSPHIFSHDSEGKEIPVGLTVSSQLPLEAAITGLKQVYTCQKSFRAELSDTIKHLAEFLHIEYEGAYHTLASLMEFTERFLKSVIKFVFEHSEQDLDFIESQFAPEESRPTRDLLKFLLDKPFVRIKHYDAVELIRRIVAEKMELPDDDGIMKRVKLQKLPQQGEDVSSEHEKLLVRYFGWTMLTDQEKAEVLKEMELDRTIKKRAKKCRIGAFVFLTHWPLKIKSFYMKQCDDGSGECESFDLLAPVVGEMFGGSMREWRYEKLDAEVKRRGMDLKPIQWFLDLRKWGSMPHGGWGMGFARLCTLITGAPSVRDTVFLPVYYKHCPY